MILKSIQHIRNISISHTHTTMEAVAAVRGNENMSMKVMVLLSNTIGTKAVRSIAKKIVIIDLGTKLSSTFVQFSLIFDKKKITNNVASAFRHETQHDGDEISDKKHKSSSREHSKHSDHHKQHSSTTEKTHSSSKHKRSREDDHTSSSSKKPKCDVNSSSKNDKEKSSKTKFKHVDDGIEIDHSMGTSFADALGL